jgi:hypothetical protein
MKQEMNINKAVLNIFGECKMTGFRNRLLNIQECKQVLEDPETDGNCRMTEQDLADLLHETRRRKTMI